MKNILTQTDWHNYIRSNPSKFIVQDIPNDALHFKYNSVAEWFQSDSWIKNGEVYQDYYLEKFDNTFVVIKWDEFLLETVLDGRCEYFQDEKLQAFKRVYFKDKFEREICES